MPGTAPAEPPLPEPDDAATTATEAVDQAPPAGSFRRRLGAGVIDSSISSGATFLTTLFSLRYFTADQLGAYALFFSGFVLCAGLIAAFIYTPAEVEVVAREERFRLLSLRDSTRAGLYVGLLAAIAVMGFSLLVQTQVPMHLRLDFALPSIVLATFSPMQDHVRRMLHSAGRSWLAVRVSLVQGVVVAIVLLVIIIEGHGKIYGPTLGLTFANLVSLGVGFMLARKVNSKVDRTKALRLSLTAMAKRGRLLLLEAVLGFGAPYVVVLILTNIVNIGVVGQVEGVRVLSQPLTVLSVGLLSPVAPKLYAAGAERDKAASSTFSRHYVVPMVGLGAIYALLVAVPWPGSPLPHIFPLAYATHGLLAAQLVTMVAAVSTAPYGLQLIGAGWQGRLVALQAINIVLNLGVSPSAYAIGAFASPLGNAATVVSGFIMVFYYIRRLYLLPPGSPFQTAKQAALRAELETVAETVPSSFG